MLIRTYAALSGDAPTMKITSYLSRISHNGPIAIFVGAMARGSDDFADGIVDEKISISNYPLSASVACGKVSLALDLASREIDRFFSSAVRWRICGTSCNLRHSCYRSVDLQCFRQLALRLSCLYEYFCAVQLGEFIVMSVLFSAECPSCFQRSSCEQTCLTPLPQDHPFLRYLHTPRRCHG
jgi:hypothetical protein